jgi:drug/metabolite transporter (DMT)-like permease
LHDGDAVKFRGETTGADGLPQHDLAIAALLLATIVWGSGPLLVRGISAPSLAAAPVRVVASIPAMWAVSYFMGGRITKELWKLSVIPGFFFAGNMLFAFLAFNHTTVAHGSLIVALNPIVMLVVAPIMFKERVTFRKVAFSLVALSGIAMVVIFGNSSGEATLLGDFYALLCLASWSAYILLTKKLRNINVHPGAFLTTVLVIAGAILMPIGILTGADFGQIDGNDWWLILGQVVLVQIIGFGVVTWSSRYIEVTLASVIGLLSPALSAVGAWIVFDQEMVVAQILGGIIMLMAVGGVIVTRDLTASAVRPVDTGAASQ